MQLVKHCNSRPTIYGRMHYYKLNNCKIENVPGIGPDEYSCLILSFDKLVEDAKSCLLLCSLFPEDADIHIRTLIQLAKGSQLVHGGSIHA